MMSDDVRDRARETIARELSPYFWHSGLDEISAEGVVGQERTRSLAHGDHLIAALDAAGIALVDAELATWFRERIAQQREEIERLEDERRRLLTFRDAVDTFETTLGVYENCMDAHCGVGGFCDKEQEALADLTVAVQRKGLARAAVADIEPEVKA